MITYDYEYDLTNHPYLSEIIDEDSGVITQTFTIPPGVNSIRGFRIKVSKFGSPSPIHYSIDYAKGGNEIADGTISPDDVLPVFEQMVGGDFPPVPVKSGEVCYLNLRVLAGKKPHNAYRLYGPNTRSDTGDDSNIRLPYWWYQEVEALDDLDIPLPQKYHGAQYPDYRLGSRVRSDGKSVWNISFAILTDQDPDPLGDTEQRFEFVRQLVAPPFTEWSFLRDTSAQPGAGDLTFDGSWGMERLTYAAPTLQNAQDEIAAFLGRVMGVNLDGWRKSKRIVFRIEENRAIPPGSEGSLIHVTPNRVTLTARDPKGILRAVHWLEDQMLARRAPIVACGTYRIGFRYDLRMAPGIYPAPTYYQLQDAQIWTRGYVWRLARAGYNAIYWQVNLEELVEDSAIFPEMNDPQALVAIARLRSVVELAAEYGVDVYLDLKTGYYKPFSEAVYQRLPEVRSFARHGNYPCSGQQITLDFYSETIGNLFRKVEKLKGLIVIYDTEGFFSCFVHNSIHKCPYCKDFPIETLSTRLFQTFAEAIRVANRDTELILWTYFCDEEWNYKVIRNMPPGVTLMACYSQFVELDRCGVKVLTDDYSVCSEKPGDYYLKIQRLAKEKGIRLICKTEDTFGQEFVSTPYTPCLTQHQRRWDHVHQQDAQGFLAQYVHIGFMPNPCADLTRLNVTTVEKDGTPVILSPQEKLQTVAEMNYGAAASAYVVKAWECFSQAIHDYFPYTWGVCRYPGPLQSAVAQPFFMDPKREMPRRWSRGYVADLRWTGIDQRFLVDHNQKWDASVVSRCFQQFLRLYGEGIQHLQQALATCESQYRDAVSSAGNVARMQYLLVRSLTNFIQFIRLRDAYCLCDDTTLREALAYVCESEMGNASEALRLCQRDSRLGFSCEGAGTVRGGLFTPAAIRQKIASLQETLAGLYLAK
ncbi:MAG: hypothetical protein IT330_04775 [Anaerolineae bacterium]|nr:hypothetical protein [Anaerolineae bacterium]